MVSVTDVTADAGEVTDEQVLGQVAAAFGLGSVREADVIAEGLMNRNWRVTTDGGVVAVKQVLDVDATAARRQHAAAAALAARELPVLAPLRTTGGDTLADIGGQVYSAAPWAHGHHRAGWDLTIDETAQLGRLLADLHTGLAAVMAAAPPTMAASVTEPATVKDKIDRYEALIAARPVLDDMDRFVTDELAARRGLLERVAHLRPADDVRVGPVGWTHGDYQHLNVLYGDVAVLAVLDWDRLSVRPLAAELVRSATLLFGNGDAARGLDLERVTAFTRGYRTGIPLTDAEVADAVDRLWWERVCDLWQLRRRYQHGDTSCEHLFVSASALLAWWTAHRDAVNAAFTSAA